MIGFYRAWLSIRDLEVPTIAAINGPAVGAGLCLALACDLRYAATSARMSVPFVKLGMHAGMAATYTLPNVVGEAHARDLLLTGRMVGAEEALRIGLVSEVARRRDVPRRRARQGGGRRGDRADREPADHGRAARRRSRRLRVRAAVGGARPAGDAGHRGPPGRGPGLARAAGAGVPRAVTPVPAGAGPAPMGGRGRPRRGIRQMGPGRSPRPAQSLTCLPLASDGPSEPGASCADEPRSPGRGRSTP